MLTRPRLVLFAALLSLPATLTHAQAAARKESTQTLRSRPWLAPELEDVRGPCSVTPRLDISLGQHRLQAMDLYSPSSANGAAVVVIHGGGWQQGDKRGMALLAGLLASHGFVAVSVNYRLSPAVHWPAHLEDCQLALGWLNHNARALGIKPDSIGALGTSAGGHLAAMLALVDGELAEGGKVLAACNYFGPSDLRAHGLQSPFVRKVLIGLLGAPLEQAPELYRAASPIACVDPGDAPVQICQGKLDQLVPAEQATRLHQALKAAGVPTELVMLENEGHAFHMRMRSEASVRRCFMQSVRWLRKWLVEGRE